MKYIALAAALFCAGAASAAGVKVGQAAPDFTLVGDDGQPHQLSKDIAAHKIIVLEWFNPGCPFVHKYYDQGNMQSLQSKYAKQNVVWYSIDSAAKGNEGWIEGPSAVQAVMDKNGLKKGAGSTLLFDPTGKVGQTYGAKTTPHMFVIDAKGNVAYEGAIDDQPTPRPDSLKGADVYVADALDAVLSGKPVAKTHTVPYGCSVKY